MPFDLDHALRYLIASEGSDLHLKIPSPPLVRLHGKLEPIPGLEPLSPEDTIGAVQEMLQDPNKLAEFEAENPDIHVVVDNVPDPETALRTRLVKNDVPDVLTLNGNGTSLLYTYPSPRD